MVSLRLVSACSAGIALASHGVGRLVHRSQFISRSLSLFNSRLSVIEIVAYREPRLRVLNVQEVQHGIAPLLLVQRAHGVSPRPRLHLPLPPVGLATR